MTRPEILDNAIKCVCGKREQDYGSPENNFQIIADLWSAYYGHKFTAVDVAMMMTLLKIARIRTGTATEDSFVDAAGYIACGGEIAAQKKENGKDGINFINFDDLVQTETYDYYVGDGMWKRGYKAEYDTLITTDSTD